MSKNALNHMPKQAHMAHTSICFCGSVWFLSLFFFLATVQEINFEACHSAALTLWRDSHCVESEFEQQEGTTQDVIADGAL